MRLLASAPAMTTGRMSPDPPKPGAEHTLGAGLVDTFPVLHAEGMPSGEQGIGHMSARSPWSLLFAPWTRGEDLERPGSTEWESAADSVEAGRKPVETEGAVENSQSRRPDYRSHRAEWAKLGSEVWPSVEAI